MRPVDKRADIWAFGVVVYEMLTGRHAFPGDTVTDVLSAVISHDPDWAALPSNVPAAIVTVLRRCLEKDHGARLRDIGEARVALAQVIAGTTDVGSLSIASTPSRGVRLLPWMIAGIAVAAAIGVWTMRPAADAPLRKLELSLPSDLSSVALSPDGARVATRSRTGVNILDLERLESRQLAAAPSSQRNIVFWSPDGQFVAYTDADGKLWIVPAAGGSPRQVSSIPETRQLMSPIPYEDCRARPRVQSSRRATIPRCQ